SVSLTLEAVAPTEDFPAALHRAAVVEAHLLAPAATCSTASGCHQLGRCFVPLAQVEDAAVQHLVHRRRQVLGRLDDVAHKAMSAVAALVGVLRVVAVALVVFILSAFFFEVTVSTAGVVHGQQSGKFLMVKVQLPMSRSFQAVTRFLMDRSGGSVGA